jgi:hypothetical protein
LKKSVIGAAIAIAVVGIVVAAVPIVEQYAAARIKDEIEKGSGATVGKVEVGLFDRRIALHDLKSTLGAEIGIGRVEASGLAWPIEELLQGRTPIAGLRWGDPLKAERIELRDVRMLDPAAGTDWGLSALVIDGFNLARFDIDYDGPYRFLALFSRAMAALTIRRLEQDNAVFAMPGSGDTFGVAKTVLERYAGGLVAVIDSHGTEATAKDGKAPLFKIGDIATRGLDLRRILAAFSSNEWRPGMPIGQLKVERASASGFGGDTLARYGVSLGSVTIETVRESDQVSRSSARIDGFVLAPPLRSLESLQLRLVLQTMGLKELRLGFDCNSTEDRAKAEITIDRCALLGIDLGEINLTARVVGADEEFWRAVDDGDSAALYDSKAALASARLVLADKSLLERALKALATTTGQPVSTTRANLARDIRRYQPPDVLITQDLTQLLDTVARFVEHGGTLTFDARPDPPLAIDRIDYLASPGADLVTALGLSATLSR